MLDDCGSAVSFVTGEAHIYVDVRRAVDLDWKPGSGITRSGTGRNTVERSKDETCLLSLKVKYKMKYHRR